MTPLASPAGAVTPGCDSPNIQHCYSNLRGTGTTFYGMYGTWNRALMLTAADGTNQRFMNSAMWFPNDAGSLWAEVGLKSGWFPSQNRNGYFAFYSYQSPSGFTRNYISDVTPNQTVTDKYQISRSGTTNKWNVYFDGQLFTTPDLGFWAGSMPTIGAEVATPVGGSQTFNMYAKGLNSGGSRVNFGTQGAIFVPAQPGNPLNGVSYQNSEWSWNTKA